MRSPWLVLMLLPAVFAASGELLVSVAKAFMGARHLSVMTAFVCCHSDEVRVAKRLMGLGMRIAVFSDQEKEGLLRTSLSINYQSMAVVIDMSCAGAQALLRQACAQGLLTRLHAWLLLLSDHQHPPALSPPLDSRVTLVQGRLVWDVYRLGPDGPLSPRSGPSGSQGDDSRLRPRGTTTRATSSGSDSLTNRRMQLQILQDPWEHFFDLGHKHLNTWTKVNYLYTSHVARILDFRMQVVFAPHWGYPNANGSYDGVIGMLQRGEVDLAGGGIFMQVGRLDVVDFAATTNLYNGKFVFLQPLLAEMEQIYSRAFSTNVWCTILVALVVLTGAILLTHKVKASDEPLTFSDACLQSLGVVCQQGSCFDSPRTVYLTLLVLSVSLYTAYSAIIVTLLQAPGPPIRTLTDLMASPLQLCMQDLISNTKYVNETIDPEVKRLFREKLYPQPPEVAFTTPEKGLAKVKEGLVAFHGDMASGFKINSDTFEESAKCRLRYVQMITSVKITIPVKKGSPYGEHLRSKMMWVREAGLLKREDLLWVSQAPKCTGDGPGFVVIGFAEVSPILEVFIYGSFLAGTFFVLEMAFRRLCQRSD